jgi:hypothetical protein
MKPWFRGELIILRNIARSDGTVTTAIPAITVQDERDLLAVFIPQGTRFKNNWHVSANQRASSVASIVPSGKRHYQDVECQTPSLRLYLSGFSYSVGIMFDQNGIFTGWYGNLEAPFIRTKLGLTPATTRSMSWQTQLGTGAGRIRRSLSGDASWVWIQRRIKRGCGRQGGILSGG